MPSLRLFCLFLFILLLQSCKWDLKLVDPENPKFRTNDSAVLFFKNLRQLRYNKESLSEARIDIYRHKSFSDQVSTHQFQLAIVHNWLHDEVVIFIEPGGKLLEENFEIYWEGEEAKMFVKGSKTEQFAWVAKIYNALLLEKEVEVRFEDGTTTALFFNAEEKEAFRVSCKDFFKLVQIIR